jgi:hypothetical protein
MWETDCVQFWRTGLSFELRNVTTAEHDQCGSFPRKAPEAKRDGAVR